MYSIYNIKLDQQLDITHILHGLKLVPCINSDEGYCVTNIKKYPNLHQSFVSWNDAQFNNILNNIEINESKTNSNNRVDPEQHFQEIKVDLSSNVFDKFLDDINLPAMTTKAKRLVQRYVEIEVQQLLEKLSLVATKYNNSNTIQYNGNHKIIMFTHKIDLKFVMEFQNCSWMKRKL